MIGGNGNSILIAEGVGWLEIHKINPSTEDCSVPKVQVDILAKVLDFKVFLYNLIPDERYLYFGTAP